MIRLVGPLIVLSAPVCAMAQIMPMPSMDDPRLQTVTYDPSQPVRLIVFPNTNLTVMLLPGDQIEQLDVSDRSAFDVKITDSHDSFNIVPLKADASSALTIATNQRRYSFEVKTSGGLAAYLVRFQTGPLSPPAPMPMPTQVPLSVPASSPTASASTSEYRVSGEHALRPAGISDDGQRTFIQWSEDQSLPAVFGIGPTGQEEVVDGYMRDGLFTIDRVYDELVFRIDSKKAKARRREGRTIG